MKTRKNHETRLMKRLFEQENEQLMLAVNRSELQEMLRLAEYGYFANEQYV